MRSMEALEIAWSSKPCLLTLEQLSDAAELQSAVAEKSIQYGQIEPAATEVPGMLFPVSCIERLRRIIRLRQYLGVNLAGVAVILLGEHRSGRIPSPLIRLKDAWRNVANELSFVGELAEQIFHGSGQPRV